jgi:DNA polymerase-1
MPPTLYLIDGHALAYRTYFALTSAGGRFQTASGEPTAGIFGFASVLLRVLEQEKPDYLAVAFDTGKTFRNELFPEYKATRAKMPDDLRTQIERIRKMVDAFDIPRLEKEGMEADDVIGSIARQAVEKGLGVKIITGDKDLLQLVEDRVIVSLPGSRLSESKDFSAKDVVELLGVRPDQVVDYKALVGDTSDNYPGVRGVGEKTAVKLLQEYPTLDEVYAHLDKLAPRVKELLEKGKSDAYLSQDLATIRRDVAVTLDLDKARTDQLGISAVEALFRELEFRTLIPRLKALGGTDQGIEGSQLDLFGKEVTRVGQPAQYELSTIVVNDQSGLDELQRKLSSATSISFDTETTSIDPMRADLVGISLSVREGEGYYIPLGHHDGSSQLSISKVISALTPALTDPGKQKFGHNLKYDALMLARNGLMPAPLTFDTMIAEWLTDPDSHNLGLKDMADAYLNIAMTHIEELIGKGKNQLSMADIPVKNVAPYAAADAEVTLKLVPVLQKKLEKRSVEKVFKEIEMPLIPVLVEMEMTGIRLDPAFLQQMSGELRQRMTTIEDEVYKLAGGPFNLNSTQQLSKVLFETLKLPTDPTKKTASGHYSTSADVLEELRGKHPVVDLLLEYRELSKLQSTYVEALPLSINPQTNRVHTSYSQIGAVTGRLSSVNPNLQNIPTRTELGRKVRCAFISDPGSLLLSVDYSQIELRIVADMAKDEAMLNAFRAGQDIHAATAAAIHDIPLEKVDKDQRRHAKAINFGLIYGMSAFGLTRTTGLTLAEAEDFVKEYFHDFPGVKNYLDGIRRTAAQQGYVETKLGRRRYFPELQGGGNMNIKARAEREAINAPIQGTAADIMKLAMIHLPEALKKTGLHARLMLQVHDELVLECPRAELLKTADVVRKIMEGAYKLSIPLVTDARWGENWGSMQSITEFKD